MVMKRWQQATMIYTAHCCPLVYRMMLSGA